MKTLVVIDGQGGGCGRSLIEKVRALDLPLRIHAAGTNATATAAMHKAGAHTAATGENAVVVACRKADIIAGPVGILMADALLGECTPSMANAVAACQAPKIIIPTSRCGIHIAGLPDLPFADYIHQAANLIHQLLNQNTVST